MRKLSLFNGQSRGETIVEVLVSLAAVGIVLGSSAVIVSRSSRTMITASEQSQARAIVQDQIERVRQYVAADPSQLMTASSTIRSSQFCMSDDIANTPILGASGCTRSPGVQNYTIGNLITTAANGPNGTASYTLTTTVRYDTLDGANSSVTMAYRMYP